MGEDKRWPKVGEQLTHTFRRGAGKVTAEVVGVEKTSGSVSVRIGGKVYRSLSAAANAVAGCPQNGWVYWGLKKQKKNPRD